MEGYYRILKTFILYSSSYSHILTLHCNSFKGSFILKGIINTPPAQIRGLLCLPIACIVYSFGDKNRYRGVYRFN
jgi:hypothetical protein